MRILDKLEAALASAAALDREQEHASAASLLDSAIAESNGDWLGQPTEQLLECSRLVQRCSAEADRQRWRQSLLNSYLSR